MSEENTANPPKWLMIVAGLALVWLSNKTKKSG